MAKKKKEEPIVDNEVGSLKVKEKEQPTGNETKGNVTKVKEKMKMKPIVEEQAMTKVDLSKPPKIETNAVQEQSTDEVPIRDESKTSEKVVEEIVEQSKEESTGENDSIQNEGTSVLEEITNEEVDEKVEEVKEQVKDIIVEAEKTGEPLPDSVQKLMNFMNETGGDINDYVKLNQDYSELY
jgi:glutamyl-tRNA reductase